MGTGGGEVTLQTIADALGVSRMTVSRALRNDRSIPEVTRVRVKMEAERQGYRPDPMVSALMTRLRKSHRRKERPVIAYLDAVGLDTEMGRYGYLKVWRGGVEARGKAMGYDVQYFNLPALGVSEVQMGRILESRGIRGVVIGPLTENRPFTMDFRSFAVAALGVAVTQPLLHRALSHSMRNLQIALENLDQMGLRRVGLYLDQLQDMRTEHALTAMMMYYQAGRPQRQRIPTQVVQRIRREDVFAWIERYRPEAIISFSHDIGWWLRFRGGERPLVVNLNWQMKDGSDYGIDQQLHQVGAAAADLVIEQMQANQYGVPELAKSVIMVGRWVESAGHAGDLEAKHGSGNNSGANLP